MTSEKGGERERGGAGRELLCCTVLCCIRICSSTCRIRRWRGAQRTEREEAAYLSFLLFCWLRVCRAAGRRSLSVDSACESIESNRIYHVYDVITNNGLFANNRKTIDREDEIDSSSALDRTLL